MTTAGVPVLPQVTVQMDEQPDVAHGLRPSEVAALRTNSLRARETAYCPYSSFRVGAALLGKSGVLVTGANFEVASYNAGTCAERVALGFAVTTGGLRRGDFKALGVATDLIARPGVEGDFCSPCGMCRQALHQFCEPDMPILMFDVNGKFFCKTMAQLLPMAFGSSKLPGARES